MRAGQISRPPPMTPPAGRAPARKSRPLRLAGWPRRWVRRLRLRLRLRLAPAGWLTSRQLTAPSGLAAADSLAEAVTARPERDERAARRDRHSTHARNVGRLAAARNGRRRLRPGRGCRPNVTRCPPTVPVPPPPGLMSFHPAAERLLSG